ncbi:hypothetical protein ABFT23_13240 [Nocardioides sp. C4-1]|uniref:hypothetical protein n=1 Tax=Nocardioides sp. C4-1 TaxID=3151851 RepID=UPI003266997E
MTVFRLDRALVEQAADGWDDDAELVRGVGRALRGLDLSSMPPRAVGAASAFRTAWAGHADESEQVCTGMAEALRSVCADAFVTDAEVAQTMETVDGSLGASR